MGTHITTEDAELQLDTTQDKSCKQQETEVIDKWKLMPEQPGISIKNKLKKPYTQPKPHHHNNKHLAEKIINKTHKTTLEYWTRIVHCT